MTKPSRSLSKGRLACAGSSFRVDKARRAAKPAHAHRRDRGLGTAGDHGDGVPAPDDLERFPTACADAEQAVHVARLGPLAPKRIETWPDARLMMVPGMKNGEILRGPPSSRAHVFAFDRGEAADSRSDEHADVRGVVGT